MDEHLAHSLWTTLKGANRTADYPGELRNAVLSERVSVGLQREVAWDVFQDHAGNTGLSCFNGYFYHDREFRLSRELQHIDFD